MRAEPFVQQGSMFKLADWMNQHAGLTAGITSRRNGFSKHPYESLNLGFHVGDNPEDVLKNRHSASVAIGAALDHWVGTEQVHQAVIKKVTHEDAGKGAKDLASAIKGTDGIYTAEEDLLLTSLYADCVPLFFLSPQSKLVGLAHAGWKGTVGKIGANMVDEWVKAEGIRPDDIIAAIGPSIGSCCYEVDEFVIMQVNKALPADTANFPYRQIDEKHYLLDLREVNKRILIQAGMKEENIVETSYCTSCNNEQFFSHRKELGKTGRIMSYIGRLKGAEREYPAKSFSHPK
ncbi:peptidoglycan editing factor PgeF [Fictibacillus sp. KIGAM418]|uniref:Purine nucleoside phosphorylase n=1 Tax=Fictibacillus marinisediminis TaxID=2878389 RepID=A0A9X2BDQ3_9BACL|nr:peptidoglycan editing factor PgeF [Fictibacillus marinisediminis]MCK6256930.1 peptidoglycan editing factor PgeF [Fictibacillus marinisediminis]